jgi:hypothetical protein
MRRGAAFEAWLCKRGLPREVAEEWAGHAVWATGFVAGRWNKALYDATPAELQVLADSATVDWREVGPAVVAWFDWLRGPDEEQSNPASYVRHPSAVPRLRLVEGSG